MKRFLSTALLVLLALAQVGCGTGKSASGDDRLTVCTSFYAIYDFVTEVGGDKVNAVNMVPTGTEPHDWEPSSHDMLTVSKADVLFYNGLGMESWIEKVTSSVGEDKLRYVELSDGLADESESDPHIWLDPTKVAQMTDEIADTLSACDSTNADYYRQRAEVFKAELDELDKEYTSELAPYEGNSIVVSHEAYSYLCNRYGLKQLAVEGVMPESEPSPEQMKNIINYIKDNNIKYIFFEELLSPKVVQTIADETGATLLELNPFEGLEQEDIDNGENYLSVMRTNLENLKQALAGSEE
jgi:zinc transport system substrate-binding protein